ncbi:MAG: recombinase family protein [Cyanobacteria bacterium P01_G01_bin.54]
MTVWINGGTRSGKTTQLIHHLQTWLEGRPAPTKATLIQPAVLVLVANDDNRRDLQERLPLPCLGKSPVTFKTPFGFIADEVMLFWPLLAAKLQIHVPFPIRLRPETEQVLATRLWQAQIESQNVAQAGIVEYRFIRDTLDLMQLAGAAGFELEKIAPILAMGFTEERWEHQPEIHRWRQELLRMWRDWCLERGLLSYGLLSGLYGQFLLGDRTYRDQLLRRYQHVFADDVQDYPAIAGQLLEVLLANHRGGTLTYNPESCVRLGLNADPEALLRLRDDCETQESLSEQQGLAAELAEVCVPMVLDPLALERLPAQVQCLETVTRSQLLRQTANQIVKVVKAQQVEPHEIAVIAPGLDAIARYSLMQILDDRDIPVTPLNEQNPLNTSPLVRALLTLLPLIYDGLGDLLNREQVAEMLIVLSQGLPRTSALVLPDAPPGSGAIDPVRAGLLAEHCYYAHPQAPQLRTATTYSRWDRLSHLVVEQYTAICDWVSQTRQQCQTFGWPPPVVLDRAIKAFLWQGSQIPYADLSALRGIMETAQHFWAVEQRLGEHGSPTEAPLRAFIELLRDGTITANAYPIQPNQAPQNQGVMLATIYQYRARRLSHRWHFWLDAGSEFWLSKATKYLFGAPLFLESWSGFPVGEMELAQANRLQLEQVLRDLLGRVEERLYLCHSDLSVNGLEQTGPLINLVQSAMGMEGGL